MSLNSNDAQQMMTHLREGQKIAGHYADWRLSSAPS
jgi:hypothetical protein